VNVFVLPVDFSIRFRSFKRSSGSSSVDTYHQPQLTTISLPENEMTLIYERKTHLDDCIDKSSLILHIHRFRFIHPPRPYHLNPLPLQGINSPSHIPNSIPNITTKSDKDSFSTRSRTCILRLGLWSGYRRIGGIA
jgi:hypothetical protein